jgi:hypothetical protein
MTDHSINNGESRQTSGRGKIARLPNEIREQLNQRLLDGHSAFIILPWLNGLSPVKEVLAAQFNNEPVTPQNLSNWRLAGYQHWLKDQKRLCQIKQFGQYAANLSSAQRDKMADGSAVLASCQVFEFLQSTSTQAKSIDDLLKMTNAVRPFLNAEENKTRLKLMTKKMRLKDDELQLKRKKLQAEGLRLQPNIQLNQG